jgi:16S rRNA (guanine527-N7)-methyltransferase
MKSFPSNTAIQNILLPYGIAASDGIATAIRTYAELLARWNSRVALTTVSEPEEVIRFHFGESMFAVSKLDIREGRLADIGTGAGFPGIPIRMVSEGIHLTLVEANQKKAAFLSEGARILSLSGVEVIRSRMEDLRDPERYTFDFVTARALGSYDELLRWAELHLRADGRLILWLGADEAKKISKASGWKWQQPISIPETKARVLLLGQVEGDG